MADFIKKPLGPSLNTLAIQRAQDAIAATGKALPCTVAKVVSSAFVTVNFQVNAAPFTLPQITVPIEYPEYIRYPIQVGDKGMVFSASVKLGGLTGLGSGIPDLTPPGNLSALSFVWLGTTGWSATDDTQAVVIYGPNGVILRDTSKTVTVTIKGGQAVISGNLQVNGTITSTGNISTTGGNVSTATIDLNTHHHTGVTTGGGNTGGPVG